MSVELRGITWDHSRALPPLVATAQRFEELEPGVRVSWSKRSLHEFGHADVVDLAKRFDLIVLDHPWMGYAAAHGCLLPLQPLLPPETVSDWRDNSMGSSFASYLWEDSLWAAPVDAATPCASARPDLLAGLEAAVPSTWEETLALARLGRVILPAFHVDLLLHLLMLCASHEPESFVAEDAFAPGDLVLEQMESLRELVSLVPDACFELNPIRTYEWLATSDDVAYCPFAYSYSNYSRDGFGQFTLTFHDLPRSPRDAPLRSVLGGAGMAISASCGHPEEARDYLRYTASATVQRTLYTAAGGQPAHRSAWLASGSDAMTKDFFRNSGPAMERAWLRPRYYGYPYFQEHAGLPLQEWMREGGTAVVCLERMNEVYRESRKRRFPEPVR